MVPSHKAPCCTSAFDLLRFTISDKDAGLVERSGPRDLTPSAWSLQLLVSGARKPHVLVNWSLH